MAVFGANLIGLGVICHGRYGDGPLGMLRFYATFASLISFRAWECLRMLVVFLIRI